MSTARPETSARGRLQAHTNECELCRADVAEVDRDGVAALFDSLTTVAEAPASELRARAVVDRARPELVRLARRAHLERLVAACVLSMAPLPLVAAYGTWFLGALGGVLRALLPATLASVFTASYAAALILMIAATYASVPLLVDRMAARRVPRWSLT